MAITIATGPAFSTNDRKFSETSLILDAINIADKLGIFTMGLATGSNVQFRTPINGTHTLRLGTTQQKVFDIMHEHFRSTLTGESPPQLLMIVCGTSGTGKTMLLKAIHTSFKRHVETLTI
ncbi:hypothetical protein DFH07DRAFT_948529 [Mycena maculata]|uniref:Uncharacterized protein n=1 Tax=Mycena maculata TaxID=230809 RepID=A0AAD7KHT9_9AGAR|nr:hypothetical protein DFH07DRAFT_948529 [Mycena maculata]